ncbi:MAG: IS1595 family transposase [Oscillospiraceae bacterium]|nr:IS1595 family transposase [Oscillospiraceae bacterium]
MESIANYLTDEIKEELCDYQIDSLNRTITDYINQNKEARNVVWHVCPKCHTTSDDFAKGGYTQDKNGKRKKAMLKCKVCNHRFVKDHGQLTYYSHSDSSAWNKVIADTLDGHSLESTAAEIDRHIVTVFHMRHKFLSFVEAENESAVLSDTAETDEKYVHECHKGLVKADIDHEHKQITVYKQPRKKTSPGLNDDKACIFTAVQRQGRSFIHTENMGKPSTENARCLKAHIEEGTFVFTDGCTAYEDMLEENHCPYKPLKSNTSYDPVNHLNNVNSLHSRIDFWIEGYRNVNTIYINRYNALFSLRQKFTGCDINECVINTLRWLRNRAQYHFNRNQMNNIFDDPDAMKYREGLTGAAYINMLRSKHGYSVTVIKPQKAEFTDSLI